MDDPSKIDRGLARARELIETSPEEARDVLIALRADAETTATIDHLLAEIALRERRPGAALELSQRALASEPDDASMHVTHGRALNNLRRLPAAEQAFRRALALQPSSETHNFLGHVLRAQGDMPGAEREFAAAVDLDNENHTALFNLAVTRSATDPRGALIFLRQACEIAAGNARYWGERGLLAQRLGLVHEAIAALTRAVEIEPGQANLHSSLGSALQSDGDLDGAERSFRRALALDPKHVPAQAAIAGIFDLRGEREQAVALIERAIEDHPNAPMLLIARGQLARHGSDPAAAIAGLERVLKTAGHDTETRALIEFCLGDLHDACGEFDRAFDHYQSANTLRAVPFDRHALARRTESVLAQIALLPDVARAKTASERPIFIVGMPRSGTSLTEQILASHPAVHGAGELRAIGLIAAKIAVRGDLSGPMQDLQPADLDALAAAYLDSLDDRVCERVTDKMWQNFEFLPLIEMLFPAARVVHCRRDPLDIAWSCYAQSFGAAGPPFSYDVDNIAAYLAHYRRVTNAWSAMTQMRRLDLDYEALVENFEETVRGLVDFGGLPWDDACLHFHETRRIVRTASHGQVQKPIYASAVGRHRNYAPHLGPLRRALEDVGIALT